MSTATAYRTDQGVGMWGKAWAWMNGNFYKLITIIVLLGLGLLTVWQQTNYGRLEERIVSLQSQLGRATDRTMTVQSTLQQKQEKLREQLAELNAEVKSYTMVPSQLVTNSKAIDRMQGQINVLLYRVGEHEVRQEKRRQERRERREASCSDGDC